jgi:hypothetical protein
MMLLNITIDWAGGITADKLEAHKKKINKK